VRNRSAIVAVAALAAALVTGISAAASAPYLRSAAASRGHVVAVFTLGGTEGDAVQDHIAVAVSLATQADGSFLPAKVRFQESILGATQTSNGLRVRTQHKLRPGRYYVKVSSKALALDCTPKYPCKELWSNARRVVIPRPQS
jgi:hypothetical protein